MTKVTGTTKQMTLPGVLRGNTHHGTGSIYFVIRRDLPIGQMSRDIRRCDGFYDRAGWDWAEPVLLPSPLSSDIGVVLGAADVREELTISTMEHPSKCKTTFFVSLNCGRFGFCSFL